MFAFFEYLMIKYYNLKKRRKKWFAINVRQKLVFFNGVSDSFLLCLGEKKLNRVITPDVAKQPLYKVPKSHEHEESKESLKKAS